MRSAVVDKNKGCILEMGKENISFVKLIESNIVERDQQLLIKVKGCIQEKEKEGYM